jgi:hypothetical protein
MCDCHRAPLLIDIAEMPGFNLDESARGVRAVSNKKVRWLPGRKVSCRRHGACAAVNPERTLWRCLACGNGAFILRPGRVPIASTQWGGIYKLERRRLLPGGSAEDRDLSPAKEAE